MIPGHDLTRIRVSHLSKKFCKNLRRSMLYGLSDIAKSTAGIKPDTTHQRRDEFWALKDLSFEVSKGRILGVIGANGAGKSTLLRVLAAIFPPDAGEVALHGRVTSLLTIGAGFHPHMTVKENMYINGTILGMSKAEIDEKYESILAFSGIGDFVQAPVAALSDGMFLRLGFSIAIAMKPDIFLIDEVLSVGDKVFREMCVDAIKKAADSAAILFVSHNMEIIRSLCTDVMVLDKGENICFSSDVNQTVERYLSNDFRRPDRITGAVSA